MGWKGEGRKDERIIGGGTMHDAHSTWDQRSTGEKEGERAKRVNIWLVQYNSC